MTHCASSFVTDVGWLAQLGERQTEDLKVPGSIPGLGMLCVAMGAGYAQMIWTGITGTPPLAADVGESMPEAAWHAQGQGGQQRAPACWILTGSSEHAGCSASCKRSRADLNRDHWIQSPEC